MSNIFQEVLTDAKGVEERLLGPDYNYANNINAPSDIGMSDSGSLSALAKDVGGLISYVELLVEGTGKASKTGQPLGDKFFLQTGAKCVDTATNNEVDRYIYVNNVPTGNIPFVSSGMGVNFSEFRGLIPGTMSGMNVFNPFNIMRGFLSGSKPSCQEITMEVIDVNNNKSTETHYVTTVDINDMDPCIFSNGKNPISGQSCKQAFNNMNDINDYELKLPNDKFVQLYYAGLSALAIYILYCMYSKK
jgi:hypothetical protein